MSALNPLTNEELLEHAPALFTEEPHYEVSEKYHFIPTIEVINEIKTLCKVYQAKRCTTRYFFK